MVFVFLYFQNILENFNPGLRQLVSSGRALQKALHGTVYLSWKRNMCTG